MEKEKQIKIVCTIGPASKDKVTLIKMIEAGMDIARLNFSHGDHELHRGLIKNIREASGKAGKKITIFGDLQGPRIRIGKLSKKEIILIEEQEIILFAGKEPEGKKIPVIYDSLANDVKVGDTILIDNGLIELSVAKIKNKDVYCRVVQGGFLRGGKGVNMPHVTVNLPAITPKDKKDIQFAIDNGLDALAISFVRTDKEVKELRNLIEEDGDGLKIISKIETRKAVNNFDSIAKLSDAIMIARGDLGVEVPAAEVPFIQKMLIKKCNKEGKSVITATQILSSMVYEPKPTRAEVNDIVNAILDGTDALMLSEETAIGKYPIEAVKAMRKTIDYTDKILNKYIRYGL
jgi:pyruvate kinase